MKHLPRFLSYPRMINSCTFVLLSYHVVAAFALAERRALR